jgi:transcriptional regulator with XRE-family HTH domain
MQREDWQRWMLALGNRLRRARLFLGMSQAEVASMAGVSQGAMSRLEHGKGLETPMSVVLRLHAAIARSLRAYDRRLLDDDLVWVVAFGSLLSELEDAKTERGSTDDLTQLFHAVRGLPERHQRIATIVLRSLIDTLSSPSDSRPRGDG